jgi:hypothetical protein
MAGVESDGDEGGGGTDVVSGGATVSTSGSNISTSSRQAAAARSAIAQAAQAKWVVLFIFTFILTVFTLNNIKIAVPPAGVAEAGELRQRILCSASRTPASKPKKQAQTQPFLPTKMRKRPNLPALYVS